MLKEKAGDIVSLFSFTGMNIKQYYVTKADKTSITITTARGEKQFSRKDGKEINPRNERYAGYITSDAGPPKKQGGRAIPTPASGPVQLQEKKESASDRAAAKHREVEDDDNVEIDVEDEDDDIEEDMEEDDEWEEDEDDE